MGRIISVALTLAIAYCLIDTIVCESQTLGNNQVSKMKKIYEDTIYTASNVLQTKTRTINFPPTGMVINNSESILLNCSGQLNDENDFLILLQGGQVITAIEHIDLKRLGNGARMRVTSGGVGKKFARIVLTSRRGKGIKSIMRIYAKK